MTFLDQAVGEGHYARKQILCKDWLISWSHRSRFELGLQLAREFSGKRILDYGCGDGTFLAMLMAQDAPPARAVGCEINASLVENCSRRLGDRPSMSFVLADHLDAPEHVGVYDAVICMEVVEHVVDVIPILERFKRLLKMGGTLIVSVPVETGLPLLVKQLVRRVAGWRGLGDYPGTSPYTLNEICKSVLAGSRQHIARPILHVASDSPFHDHKGFNWMVLRETLKQRFQLETLLSSPLPALSPHFNSQVWFVLRHRA